MFHYTMQARETQLTPTGKEPIRGRGSLTLWRRSHTDKKANTGYNDDGNVWVAFLDGVNFDKDERNHEKPCTAMGRL